MFGDGLGAVDEDAGGLAKGPLGVVLLEEEEGEGGAVEEVGEADVEDLDVGDGAEVGSERDHPEQEDVRQPRREHLV